jgi:hypothetical protein
MTDRKDVPPPAMTKHFAVFKRDAAWKAAFDEISSNYVLPRIGGSGRFTAGASSAIDLTADPRGRLTRVSVRARVLVGRASSKREIACTSIDVVYDKRSIPTASFRPAVGFPLESPDRLSNSVFKFEGYMEGTPVEIRLYYNQPGLVRKKAPGPRKANEYPLFKGYITSISGDKSTASSTSSGIVVHCIHKGWCLASLPPVSRIFVAGWGNTTLDTLMASKTPLANGSDATKPGATPPSLDLLTKADNLFSGFKDYLAAVAKNEELASPGVRGSGDKAALSFLESNLTVSKNATFGAETDKGSSATMRMRIAGAMSESLTANWKTQTAYDLISAHMGSLYSSVAWTADGMHLMADVSALKAHELLLDSSYLFGVSKSQMVNPRKVAGVALVTQYLSQDKHLDSGAASGSKDAQKLVMYPPQTDEQAKYHTFAEHAAKARADIKAAFTDMFGGEDKAGGAGMYLVVQPPAWASGIFSSESPDWSSGLDNFVRSTDNGDLFKTGSTFDALKTKNDLDKQRSYWQKLQDAIAMCEFGHRVWRGSTMRISTPFIPDIALGQRVKIKCEARKDGVKNDLSVFGGNVLHGAVETVTIHAEPGAFYMDIDLDMVRSDKDNELYGFPTHPLFKTVTASSETKPIFQELP